MEYLFIADESLKLSGVQIQDFFFKKGLKRSELCTCLFIEMVISK